MGKHSCKKYVFNQIFRGVRIMTRNSLRIFAYLRFCKIYFNKSQINFGCAVLQEIWIDFLDWPTWILALIGLNPMASELIGPTFFLVFLRPLLRLRRLLLGMSRTLAKLPRGKIYILKVRFVKICEMYETLHKTVLMWFISSKILFKQFYACQKAVVLLFSQNLNHCHCSVWRIPLIALKENYFLAWGQHPRTSLQKLTSLFFFTAYSVNNIHPKCMTN